MESYNQQADLKFVYFSIFVRSSNINLLLCRFKHFFFLKTPAKNKLIKSFPVAGSCPFTLSAVGNNVQRTGVASSSSYYLPGDKSVKHELIALHIHSTSLWALFKATMFYHFQPDCISQLTQHKWERSASCLVVFVWQWLRSVSKPPYGTLQSVNMCL